MKKIKKFIFMAGVCAAITGACAVPSEVKAETSMDDTITPGVFIGNIDVGGMTVDEAEAAVDDFIDEMSDTTFTLEGYNGTIEVTGGEMGMAAQSREAAERAYAIAHTGNLIERYKKTKDLQIEHVSINMGITIDKQATAMAIYNQQDTLNIAAEDNSLKRENGEFVFVAGQTGYEVDIVSSVNEISNYFATLWDGELTNFELVTNEVEPRGTQEELAMVTDVLGSFSTDFGSSSTGRATNVKNGCNKINGTVLFPGDEFSVYAAISPFTQENGYELASAYSNGMVIESFGGGICQVSTTLYNAVIRAELDVTMRYNHSMLVSYVPASDDAAIAGTYKDMRFINSSDYPIYLEGYCSGGTITFNIYGHETRSANRKISFESEILSQEPATVQFNLDSGQGIGYWYVEQGAHQGTVSRLWKIVTVDGVEESREIFNKSTYQSSPKIITVGVAGITAEQLATLNAAVATNDEATVRATVNALAAGATVAPVVTPEPVTTPEPAATETTPEPAETTDQTAATTTPESAVSETPAENAGDAQPSE
jgi:vancomycin resistance protein YoaR